MTNQVPTYYQVLRFETRYIKIHETKRKVIATGPSSERKATSLLLGAIVGVRDVTIATISSDVVVVGRCNCRLILVVVDVHTGGVWRSIRANPIVECVKLLMQVDVILLELLDPLPQKVPLVSGFIPLLN
jgi:hypothetical protein